MKRPESFAEELDRAVSEGSITHEEAKERALAAGYIMGRDRDIDQHRERVRAGDPAAVELEQEAQDFAARELGKPTSADKWWETVQSGIRSSGPARCGAKDCKVVCTQDVHVRPWFCGAHEHLAPPPEKRKRVIVGMGGALQFVDPVAEEQERREWERQVAERKRRDEEKRAEWERLQRIREKHRKPLNIMGFPEA